MTAGQQSGWAYWQFTDGNPVGASTLTDATQRANAAKYIAAKHFFRFIRPNAVRVSVSVTNAPSLNASAYLSASNTALTVVLVNSDTNPATVQVQAPAVPSGLTSFQSFTSDTNALWASNSVMITSGIATVMIPAYGICTLFGQPVAVPVPPAIVQLPQNTNVAAGANVAFSCTATGDALLSYQWSFNGLPIAAATSTTLVLTNVQSFQAGQYAVQVSNVAGAIISFPATLGVSGSGTLPLIVPQIILARSVDPVVLSFQSNPGRIYSWQVSTDLAVWSVATNFVSARSPEQFLVSPSSAPSRRYFRVSSP
jgi:hypothetical protein